MSLIPLFLDFSGELNSSSPGFGMGISPRDLFNNVPGSMLRRGYVSRPWEPMVCKSNRLDGTERSLTIGKDGFQVCLDVQQFAPNEISVKTVENSIVIDAKHEERQDEHGYISRQFTRRYDLPTDFNINDVFSTLSSDGVLTIKAPPPKKNEENVRHIQIQQTGPAHLSIGNKEKKGQEKAAQEKAAKK